jgi:hypothetical protein
VNKVKTRNLKLISRNVTTQVTEMTLDCFLFGAGPGAATVESLPQLSEPYGNLEMPSEK